MKDTEGVRGPTPGPKKARAGGSEKLRLSKAVSARTEQHGPGLPRPEPEERPILDDRVPALLFEALASVQAAIVSASQRVPYGVLRQTVAIAEEEKRELARAAQKVVAKHADFFVQHKDALEFVTALMAVNSTRMDYLLSAIDQSVASAEPIGCESPGGHVCSAGEALGIALIVLAPLGLLAVVLIVEHLRRN
jgi:hypothetical protein